MFKAMIIFLIDEIKDALKKWIITVLSRYKEVKSHGKLKACSISEPPYGWEELTRMLYNDVKWVVQRDGRGPDARRLIPRSDPRPSMIHIEIPARCPNCGTELKEDRRFLRGFTWHCISCGFKKHSKANLYEASKNVEFLARREIEKGSGFRPKL
jgi:ribosomal protein L37AE/L43A